MFSSQSAFHRVFVCNKWICNSFFSVVSLVFYFSVFLCYFQFLFKIIVFQEAQNVLKMVCLSLWEVLTTCPGPLPDHAGGINRRVMGISECCCSFRVRVPCACTPGSLQDQARVLQELWGWFSRALVVSLLVVQEGWAAMASPRQPRLVLGKVLRLRGESILLSPNVFSLKRRTLSELVFKIREVLMPKCVKRSWFWQYLV